jgi:RimJ/RimL family protein N-acetyltransferase
MKPPQISTDRLLAKGLKVHDSERVFRYRSLPEVYRYQSWRPETQAEVADFIQRATVLGFDVVDSWYQLGMYIRVTEELIGDVGLHFLPPDNEQTEMGFTVAPEHQRKGYALEAVRAVIDHLFGTMHKHRIVASVDPQNVGSIALLEKLGMRKEGLFKRSVKIRGQWEDDVVYAVLREEWASKP